MIASRRTRWNFSLDRAVEWASQLGPPLLIFEPLRVDYPWACDRFHQFVLDGMADTRRALDGVRPASTYLPYIEPHPGAGKGLLAALAADASVVVTDDYPAFMLPRMIQAAARPGRRCGSRPSTPTACCRCGFRSRRFQRRTRFVDSFSGPCRRTSATARRPIR